MMREQARAVGARPAKPRVALPAKARARARHRAELAKERVVGGKERTGKVCAFPDCAHESAPRAAPPGCAVISR